MSSRLEITNALHLNLIKFLTFSLYTPYFIAQKIRKADKKAFSAIVHKIGIISVALGLSIVLLAFLIIAGFQQNVEQKLTSFKGQLQVTKYSLSRSYEESPIASDRVQDLQQVFPSYIKEVQAFAHKTVLLKTAEAVEGVVCKGLDPQVAHEKLSDYLTAGSLINFNKEGYSHELVLSSKTATRLKLQVGDEVIAYMVQQPPRYRRLQVVGIYTTYLEELDEKLAFCDLRLIQRLNNWPDSLVGGYEVFLRDAYQASEVAEQLLAWLDYDLNVKSTAEAYAAIFDWLALMRKDVHIFLTLILLVVSSNIASIVLIQLMERTAMTGLLKALGATDRQIRHIMLWNNMTLVMKGMFWGNLVGLGLGALQAYCRLIRLDPTYYYINYLPIIWDWHMILILNVLTFLIVTIVLFLSVAVIARIRPIRAIQFR